MNTIVAEEQEETTPARKRATKYLEKYGYVLDRFDKMMKQCEQLDSQLMNVTQRYNSYQGGASSKADIGQIIVNLDSVHKSAVKNTEELAKLLNTFNRTLNKVALVNPYAATALSERYQIIGKPVEHAEVAKRMNYGEDRVKQLCAEGLDEVAAILNTTNEDEHLYTYLHSNC